MRTGVVSILFMALPWIPGLRDGGDMFLDDAARMGAEADGHEIAATALCERSLLAMRAASAHKMSGSSSPPRTRRRPVRSHASQALCTLSH